VRAHLAHGDTLGIRTKEKERGDKDDDKNEKGDKGEENDEKVKKQKQNVEHKSGKTPIGQVKKKNK